LSKFSIKIFLILVIFVYSIVQNGFSIELQVVKVYGLVKGGYGSKDFKELKNGDLIRDGFFIKSYRDSYAVLKGDYYYKIYPYTRIEIKDDLKPLSGKISKSRNNYFLDLHFYFSSAPAQGKTFRLLVSSRIKNPTIKARIYNKSGYKKILNLYNLGGGVYRVLTGFDVQAPPIKYYLQIVLNNDGGDFTEIVYPFYLKKTKFKKGIVYLPLEKDVLLKPSRKKDIEVENLNKVLSKSNSEYLWEGIFIYPLLDIDNPEIISEFGKKRFYYLEGRLKFVRYHMGVDFKGKIGDKVIAPNCGIVVFSAERITTGKTIVIDHGQEVFSLFFHLNKLFVSEGKEVKTKEKIGEVGATGIAAGSHLHWGVLVNGVYVDPIDWIERPF